MSGCYYLQSFSVSVPRISLHQIGEHSCGFSKKNDIPLASKRISRHHCKFLVTPEGVWITDLKSSHGTCVNGKKIKPDFPTEILEGDIIGISCNKTDNFSPDDYVYRLKKYEFGKEESNEEIHCVYDSSMGEKSNTCQIIDLTDDVENEPHLEKIHHVRNNSAGTTEKEKSTILETVDKQNKRLWESIEDIDHDRDIKKLKKTTKSSQETENINIVVKEDPYCVNENLMEFDPVEEEISVTSKTAQKSTNMVQKLIATGKINKSELPHLPSSYRIPKLAAQPTAVPTIESITKKAPSSKVFNYEAQPYSKKQNTSKFHSKKSFPTKLTLSKVSNDDSCVKNKKKVLRENSSPEKPSPKARNDFSNLPTDFSQKILNWRPEFLLNSNFSLESKVPPSFLRTDVKSFPHLTSYLSFGAYYKTMSTFILLELWAHLLKDFNKSSPIFLVAIYKNNSSVKPDKRKTSTEFSIEMLCDEKQINKSAHPKPGDLVILMSYPEKQFEPVFVNIKKMKKKNLKTIPNYNKCLKNTVPNPSVIITYTVTARSLPSNLQYDKPQKLQIAYNMSLFERMINNVAALKSPLRKAIMSPLDHREIFSLPPISNYESYKFVTGDKLSENQKKVIIQITKTVVEASNKIILIDGPSGTGKTQMIANIVTELIYGNNKTGTKKPNPVRILVCAQSNVATDEITKRLLKVRNKIQAEDNHTPFRIVRVGNLKFSDPEVLEISLNTLSATTPPLSAPINPSIKKEISLMKEKIIKYKERMDSLENMPENERNGWRKKYNDCVANLQLLETSQPPSSSNEDQLSQEQHVLKNAHIVICTLSSSVTREMKTTFGEQNQFSICIVDEASLSNEPESLLPLKLGIKQLILLGDSNQTNDLTVSKAAKANSYDKSLFTRLVEAFDLDENNPVITLDTQYRSAKEIISWPKQFFPKKLDTCTAIPNNWPFHSFRMFNLNSVEDCETTNLEEAKFIESLIYTFTLTDFDRINRSIRIGVITPYNNQRKLLSNLIEKRIVQLPDNIRNRIDVRVNTTDWFRGQEFDIIILSCTRSQELGFLSDIQRLCHIFTRAKYSFFLCGNFDFLKNKNLYDDHDEACSSWQSLLKHAIDSNSYRRVDSKITTRDMRKCNLVMGFSRPSTDV